MSASINQNKNNSNIQTNESFTPQHHEIAGLLKSIEELAIFGFWEWNIQTGKVLWSDYLFKMFGRDKTVFEPSFENFILVVHEKDKEFVIDKITEAVEQQITLNYNFTGVLPSGEERIFQTWGGINNDNSGEPLKVTGVVIDITDRKEKQYKIQKLNDELHSKNMELNESNDLLEKRHNEKEALLKEIHHRIKNNLQIVNSMLRFQSAKINEPKTLGILKDIENRIFSISSLHEKLYKSHDLRHISIRDHFEDLITQLIIHFKDQYKINTKINIEDIKLTSEQLIPIGLILNELISNSLEHAFVDKNEGEIYFSLSSSKAKEITIIIGDNGIGIPSNSEVLRKGSVGMDLVNVFVEQLNGQLTCLKRKGTFYELKFMQKSSK
jgi:PAS domain S-box-containing protein